MRVGDYRLLRLVGRGGMGEVWEAEQVSLGGRRVAMKFLLAGRDTPKELDLFRREARAGGRLSHPGIIAVYGYGLDSGHHWIAMEFVEGDWTLRDFIDDAARQEQVPPGYDRAVADFVAKVAEALQVAHESGVIHRDLKPQNILVTRADEPKVTDFGLARIEDEAALSRSGEIAGTYYYMSPEQVAARRKGIDHRTDVFSLGVVLYEMLALRRPFEGDTTHQIAAQIMTREPPGLQTIRSRVPKDLVTITSKALEKDPGKRYASMQAFASDLRRFRADEPILAKPASPRERAVKWVRRNPTKSVAAALSAIAFLLVSASLIQTSRARRELATANTSLESQRASLASEVASVKRLSALQTIEDLVDAADDAEVLWPAVPSRIPEYERWIARARALVDDLPMHREKLAELRAFARPRTPEERQRDRESHPDYPRLTELTDELSLRRHALQRRKGEASDELPAEPESTGAASSAALLERAERRFARGEDEAALAAAQAALDAAGDGNRDRVQASCAALEERVAHARSAEGLAESEVEIARMETRREELDRAVDERTDWRFPPEHADARWWSNQLEKLIAGLEALTDESTGLLAPEGISPEHGWSIPRRLERARELSTSLAADGEYAQRWNAALPAIARAYPGLELPVQIGLVPIGADPVSGLWEFWHVQSGVEPVRSADGMLFVTEETGIVLVLLPGGTFPMGTDQRPIGNDGKKRAFLDERPVHEVTLSPFFVSKYEMTQGQWLRTNGSNPCRWRPGGPLNGMTLAHPMSTVSWIQCQAAVGRLGLSLPSEAQWEYACRAGTEGAFSCGRDELYTHANVGDQDFKKRFDPIIVVEPWSDGFAGPAPVSALAPNPFGLYQMHGNVWEWCLDGYEPEFYARSPSVDPVAPWRGAAMHCLRGGSFYDPGVSARTSNRNASPGASSADSNGLRPARALNG